MRRLDPLLEETFAALVGVSILGAVLALLFWLITGASPWPGMILGTVAGLGFGVALLALTAPRRDR